MGHTCAPREHTAPTSTTTLRHWHLYACVLSVALWLSCTKSVSSYRSQSRDGLSTEVTTESTAVPKRVLAFYYGWYGNPSISGRWINWRDVDETKASSQRAAHHPRLGPYDAHDPKVLARHCMWAKKAGIDAFIASWWAPKDFTDDGLPSLLDTARRFGLEVTAYVETSPKGTREQALEYVLYLLQQYAHHPAWLRLHGKPVLFVYSRVIGQIGLEGWRWVIAEANRQYAPGVAFIGAQLSKSAADVFDGIHTYTIAERIAGKSPAEIRAWARQRFPEVVAITARRLVCITVIPGYDDSRLGRPGQRPITDRYGESTYRILWEEAIAARPDWILVTSWNEWFEGTEIEPSVENGNRDLEITARLARQFRARTGGHPK